MPRRLLRRPAVLALALALLPIAAPRAAAAALRREQTRIETAYRQALATWLGGDEEGALAQLSKLDEAGAVGTREAAMLQDAKLGVGAALGRRAPVALLAMAAFEEQAYVAYATHRPPLAAEARRTAAALVDEHGSRDRSAAATALDAAVLASLGGELATRSQQIGASELYQRALAIAPGQPAALLGLAALHEQRGEYALAADLLTRLVAVAPQSREGRLRLALNRLRLGRQEDAERELRALGDDGVDWIRSLACQEMARLLVARGDVAGAAALLGAAVTALPCDPSLPVQAALVAERAGTASPLDLSTLGTCGEAAESARARYTHPPTSELVPLREGLAAARPAWRQALATALGVRAKAAA